MRRSHKSKHLLKLLLQLRNSQQPLHKKLNQLRMLLNRLLSKHRLMWWRPLMPRVKVNLLLSKNRLRRWLSRFWRMLLSRHNRQLVVVKPPAVNLKLRLRPICRHSRTTKNLRKVKNRLMPPKRRKISMMMKWGTKVSWNQKAKMMTIRRSTSR